MAWDPKAQRVGVRREIESSRDEQGVAHGAIVCTPWGARERLAYENRMSEAVKYDVDPTNEGLRIRKVMSGKLRLIAVQLTVTGSEGFGSGADFASEEWLGDLDADVFEEVAALALEVQPLPTAGPVKKPADRKAPDAPAADEDDDEGDGDAADPTRRPSTPEA